MAWLVIESIENEWIRAEYQGVMLDLPLHWLPEPQVGQVWLVQSSAGQVHFQLDSAEAARRLQLGQTRLDALNTVAPEGDIEV